MTDRIHMVAVNVDVVQLVLIRTRRAGYLLRLHNYADEAEKLDEVSTLLREEIEKERSRGTMKRLMAFMSLITLFAVVPVMVAQELPGRSLEPVAGISADAVWPMIAVAALVLIGIFEALHQRNYGKLFERYDEALKRKDVLDAGEEAFKRSAITVQDAIKLISGLMTVLDNVNLPVVDAPIETTRDYLDKITDGLPNEPAETAQG